MVDEAELKHVYEARDRYVQSLGDVDSDVLAPLIDPAIMGGPAWPDLHQAWRVIRRGANTLIMSDGLSDPFSDRSERNLGFGLEVIVETPDLLPEPLQATWLFDLVDMVSQQCAHHGGIREIVDRNGMISFELPVTPPLQPFATENGMAGVLLGIEPPDFASEIELPAGRVKVLTAKLLWPSELAHIIALRKSGRDNLAQRFAADGTHHRSSLERKPVI